MATYTAPTTRSSGFLVTAAVYNTDLVENIKYFKDAPTFDGAVTASSTLTVANNAGLAATKKLYLDGVALTGDTYISESSANVLSLFSGGVEAKLTSGVLTVSGLGTHTFSAGGTGGNAIALRNTAGGTGDYTYLVLGNDLYTNALEFYALSSTYTTSGIYVQGSAVMRTRSAAGLSIAADHASGVIRFYTSGSTKRWEIDTTGALMPGTNDAYGIGSNSVMVSRVHISGVNPVYIPNISASTGTTLLVDGDGNMKKLSSSARYKEHIEPLIVSPESLAAFVALSPKHWDYIGTKNGAAGFISEDLDALPIRNAYGSSPLINYNDQGQPESNRDFAIIGIQHLVLQQHDATIQSLAARIAALESK